MPVERNLDDELALPRELLGQDASRALVGVPVGVVEHHDGALQQAGQSAVGQPVHRLAGRGGAVSGTAVIVPLLLLLLLLL